jgi:hypothetical protein
VKAARNVINMRDQQTFAIPSVGKAGREKSERGLMTVQERRRFGTLGDHFI